MDEITVRRTELGVIIVHFNLFCKGVLLRDKRNEKEKNSNKLLPINNIYYLTKKYN